MNDPGRVPVDGDQWALRNDAWLEAALVWLRLRLERLAEEAGVSSGTAGAPLWGVGSGGAVAGASTTAPGTISSPGTEPRSEPTPAPAATGGRGWLFGRGSPRAATPDPPKPAPPALPSGAPRNDALDRAAAAMAAAAEAEPAPALHLLGDRLGLSNFEREILLLCAAMELDTRIAGLCADAQGDPSRPYPTFALALALFDDPSWDALTPDHPLRYWRLVEINQPGAQPLTTSPLRADERIVSYIKGLNYLDDRLVPFLTAFDAVAGETLPPSQEAARASAERALRQADGDGAPALVQLVGVDSPSKQLVAQRAAHALGLVLYRMPTESLPRGTAEMDTLIRLWLRECTLLPVALYIDAHDGEGGLEQATGEGGAPPVAPLTRFLARLRGAVMLSVREVRAGIAGMTHAVEVARPTAAEQVAIWAEALGPGAGDDPAALAAQFDLNAFAIQRIVRAASADPSDGDARDRLWRACLTHTAPRLDRLAQRLTPLATWDDIVLPPEEMSLLRQLAAQVAQRPLVYDEWGFRQRMNRGLGISALFVGESGTGKTMAAEVIANHLRLNLYRIDLSAVVSKYIGETEKNLRQLFDAAEDGGAILFFDEADALFGKRSEVRDSHDRYANIEINYLLQRIEAYRGLAILATNKRSALDPAFMRRLRFIVTFPFPSRLQRRALWERAWPPGAPVEDLNYERLARLNLVGGNIANVAINAAFLAAERRVPITMPLVLEAARAEYDKLDRPVNDVEFRWGEPSSQAAIRFRGLGPEVPS